MMATLMEVGTTVTATPVLKCVPEDFAVQEMLLVECVDEKVAEHQYLTLRKKGLTTMEAVRMVASKLGLPTGAVTYGGLKDEDGVTEQLLAVPFRRDWSDSAWHYSDGTERYLTLQHYGFGADGLEIGGLQGNAFRIILRNLDKVTATRLQDRRKINHIFLNYYDTQRFGVPGGPKRTHHVGAAMSAGQWDLALEELIGLRAPESASARAWTGKAEEYFRDIDWRTASFYLAAHSSSSWNESLRDVVAKVAPESMFEVSLEGIDYSYVRSSEAAVKVMDRALDLPQSRLTYRDGEFTAQNSHRATVVQSTIRVRDLREDIHFAGRQQVELRLFLPSGSYATAAVRQLLGRMK